MKSRKHLTISAIGAALLVACGGSGGGGGGSGETPFKVSLQVLSSAPQYVSGGDARIEIQAPQAEHDRLQLWLNGAPVDPDLAEDGDRLEGVLSGLAEGDNTLEVRHPSRGKVASLELTNHPITGPMFSGPHQEPFVCSVVDQLGREPLPDTSDSKYFAVRDGDNTIGYSKDCSIESYVTYYYVPAGGSSYKPMPTDGSRPADMGTTTLDDGRTVDFIVRWERGTINRFIYQYVMLAPLGEDPEHPDTSLWNRKLVYHFEGGVGFGNWQGKPSNKAGLITAIGKGYAIAYSTGTRTSTHYNLVLGGETAMMTKEGFIKRYGVPIYTVGLGASGGAIQQYLYAQNHPGLIDAAIPQQPYPDMVGQIPHVGDCELLEYYMDVTDHQNPKWQVTKNRSWLVGMNAEDSVANPFAGFDVAYLNNIPDGPRMAFAPGSTECRAAWTGLTAGAINPQFDADGVIQLAGDRMDLSRFDDFRGFSHFEDARKIYGVGADGYARMSWDNVGVQYGLQAMKDGHISPAEFLDLNFKIGGWKQPGEMVAEGFPYTTVDAKDEDEEALEQFKAATIPGYFDPWGARNMNRWNPAAPDIPAPRTHGSLAAIQAMYQSGLVFRGEMDIPTIDWHPYLEHRLDMHNVHQSFAVRQRIRNAMGSADNQVIWFTDTPPTKGNDFDQIPMALEVMDEWMARIRANPDAGAAANRPARAVDSCFDTSGALIASGNEVWDGVLDDKTPGACTQQFPMYRTSRIVAGGPIEGGIFKCALKPVDTALVDGTYGSWAPTPAEIDKLKAIFPEGVCDFSQPDQGRS